MIEAVKFEVKGDPFTLIRMDNPFLNKATKTSQHSAIGQGETNRHGKGKQGKANSSKMKKESRRARIRAKKQKRK